MRRGSTWLERRLASLTDLTHRVTRDISYLTGRTVATPKSGRPTARRRHVECSQPSIVAELILRGSCQSFGEIKVGRLREE
jgi:hypothetical protein